MPHLCFLCEQPGRLKYTYVKAPTTGELKEVFRMHPECESVMKWEWYAWGCPILSSFGLYADPPWFEMVDKLGRFL